MERAQLAALRAQLKTLPLTDRRRGRIAMEIVALEDRIEMASPPLAE